MVAVSRAKVLAAAVQCIGERASYVVGDMRDQRDATRMAATVRRRHGRLDVLVNDAGGRCFSAVEHVVGKTGTPSSD